MANQLSTKSLLASYQMFEPASLLFTHENSVTLRVSMDNYNSYNLFFIYQDELKDPEK